VRNVIVKAGVSSVCWATVPLAKTTRKGICVPEAIALNALLSAPPGGGAAAVSVAVEVAGWSFIARSCNAADDSHCGDSQQIR
jgi:hypothetical protein